MAFQRSVCIGVVMRRRQIVKSMKTFQEAQHVFQDR
jgi:hypothetical protein